MRHVGVSLCVTPTGLQDAVILQHHPDRIFVVEHQDIDFHVIDKEIDLVINLILHDDDLVQSPQPVDLWQVSSLF